ncbi:MAG: hypothetical protein AAF518_19785 [Spirochaetota bacterium]
MLQVETFHIKDWEESYSGLVLAENDSWVLVQHIPMDYAIDGYRLYRKEFVVHRERGEWETRIEKVLSLKNTKAKPPEGFAFSNTLAVLQKIEENYGLFEFQDTSEGEVFYGKLKEVKDKHLFTIDFINPDGSVDHEFTYDFDLRKLITITFLSDYFHSMVLLWKDGLGQS